MSDLICRKSMARCLTPVRCSRHGGCRDDAAANGTELRNLRTDNAQLVYALKQQEQSYLVLRAERDQLKADNEALRKDSEAYRLLSFCHGQGTLELVRSHNELCAEIRRLKILAGEPVPPTPEEFVGPSPEGPTARIRRKLAARDKGAAHE